MFTLCFMIPLSLQAGVCGPVKRKDHTIMMAIALLKDDA